MTSRMKINIWKVFLLLAITVTIYGCGIYKFTSVEFNKDIKTFSIQNFTMATAGGPPNLTLNFNEKLKEYYQRNTDLKFRTSDGDLHLEGTIIAYELSPISATAGDKAAMNRLTITVQVKFTNKLQEEQNFDKDFSFYQDFPQDQSLSQVEPNLVPKILDQLVLNIFNSTAATW